jgi:hypothetical protein
MILFIYNESSKLYDSMHKQAPEQKTGFFPGRRWERTGNQGYERRDSISSYPVDEQHHIDEKGG